MHQAIEEEPHPRHVPHILEEREKEQERDEVGEDDRDPRPEAIPRPAEEGRQRARAQRSRNPPREPVQPGGEDPPPSPRPKHEGEQAKEDEDEEGVASHGVHEDVIEPLPPPNLGLADPGHGLEQAHRLGVALIGEDHPGVLAPPLGKLGPSLLHRARCLRIERGLSVLPARSWAARWIEAPGSPLSGATIRARARSTSAA